jgi:hypothetical protein
MSWPYDAMVVVIVAFVLLTPRAWFHDQPLASHLPTSGVRFVSQDAGGQTRNYRIDASVLSLEKRSVKPTPELERELHDILGRTVQDLKGNTFQVLYIQPVRVGDGPVIYYEVSIHM